MSATPTRGLGRAVLAASLAGGWIACAPPAGADPIGVRVTAVGWWSRQAAAMAQPAGGFQVAYGVDGAESVAAVRIEVPRADGLRASLVMTESPSSVMPSRAAVRVCTTTGSWSAANPGSYQQAPRSDCSHPVVLTRATTGRWTADISSLVTPGATANLMIEPVGQPVVGATDPGYTITVSGVAVSADGAAPPAGPATGSLSANAAPAPSPAVDANPTPVPSSFAAPTVSAAPTAPATGGANTASPAPTASAPPGPDPASTTAPAVAGPVFASHAIRHTRPWWRLLLFVPLSALFGVVMAAVRRARPASLSLSVTTVE